MLIPESGFMVAYRLTSAKRNNLTGIIMALGHGADMRSLEHSPNDFEAEERGTHMVLHVKKVHHNGVSQHLT
jgi:hypothetical protein